MARWNGLLEQQGSHSIAMQTVETSGRNSLRINSISFLTIKTLESYRRAEVLLHVDNNKRRHEFQWGLRPTIGLAS
jgi:hypothetical protein